MYIHCTFCAGNAMGYIRMIRSGGLHCCSSAIRYRTHVHPALVYSVLTLYLLPSFPLTLSPSLPLSLLSRPLSLSPSLPPFPLSPSFLPGLLPSLPLSLLPSLAPSLPPSFPLSLPLSLLPYRFVPDLEDVADIDFEQMVTNAGMASEAVTAARCVHVHVPVQCC